MAEFQKVRGSHEISIRAADLLEDMRPRDYNGSNRAKTVRTINDILQGRAQRTVDSFLLGLRNTGGVCYAQRVGEVCQDVQAFLSQKALLSQPYTKTSKKQYKYPVMDLDPEHPLKVVNQRRYDLAAKAGFPSGFFRDTYFEHVTFYCLPDGADLSGSTFDTSFFNVCRIVDANFRDTDFFGSAFSSCEIRGADFSGTMLGHTHFHDCSMKRISFQNARLADCNTVDCTMNEVNFLSARLDGASYGRITPSGIKNLDTAVITQGGATTEEIKRLRASIFEALQVPELSLVQHPKATRRRPRRTGPER